MPVSEAHKKATKTYIEKNYSRIPLDVRKEFHDKIRAVASKNNESVNMYIKIAIQNRMEGVSTSPASDNLNRNNKISIKEISSDVFSDNDIKLIDTTAAGLGMTREEYIRDVILDKCDELRSFLENNR